MQQMRVETYAYWHSSWLISILIFCDSSVENLNFLVISAFFFRHFIHSICSLKNMKSHWKRTRSQKSKTSIKCLRYKKIWNKRARCFDVCSLTHCCNNRHVLALYLTDVDRVWTHSAPPGSSPERCGERMGKTNRCHVGKREEPEAWGGKVCSATEHINTLSFLALLNGS